MERKTLKLAIIQKVTACEDDQVLQTVWSIFEQLSDSSSTAFNANAPLLEAILGKSNKSLSISPPTEQEITELQQSIDDIFGTNS